MSFYKQNKYYIILFVAFAVLVYLEYSKPKDINWKQSYSAEDKIPYGSYILKEELKAAFPEKAIISNEKTYYQFLKNESHSSILFITDEFSPSETDLNILLKHLAAGNNIFIAANEFSRLISDTLKFEKSYSFYGAFSDTMAELSFTNKQFNNEIFVYKKAISNNYFTKFDTTNTTVLGNNQQGVNFIKTKFHKGNLYLNLEPLAFTNFAILAEKNFEYPFNALSYLPYGEIVWDEFYKPAKSFRTKQTPLYFILETPTLKYAWFIILFGVIFYVLFKGKRLQRIIPVITPPSNTSLEFIETIGRLYFFRGSHKDLAEKKFSYFSEYLRSNYFLKTNNFTNEHYQRIAEKTGVGKNLIADIFNKYRKIANQSSISQQELFSLNKDIETFYSKTSSKQIQISNNKIFN